VTLVRTGFIPLPSGDAPGFDHADFYRDSDGRRLLYVAHTGADRVDVIDCTTNTYLRSIGDLPGVAGVLIDSEQSLLFTSDRGCSRISVFTLPDETLLGRVAVGAHPNGLAYDRRRRGLYAFNLGEPIGESCSVSIVDLNTMSVTAEIALPGRPRWAIYDQASDLIYANIRDPAVILRINPETHAIVGSIDVPAAGPHGLWIDGQNLYCAADGGALVALDRDSGTVLANIPLPGVPDVVWHDPRTQRLYVAVGDPGTVTVIDTARLTVIETVSTESDAHTLAWDSDGGTLYVFCPGSNGIALYADDEIVDTQLADSAA
jgi:DNA-binding beta-propeller fold protein YncE